MFGFGKKKRSSRELNQIWDDMSSLQKEHYSDLTSTMDTDEALEIMGVKNGNVPAYETKEQWKKIKKHL